DRKGWDIQWKAGKVSEKGDEKLDGAQPVAVGTWSHRRISRRAQKGNEIGLEPARGGDRFGRRFETVRAEEGGSREESGDGGLREARGRRRVDVPVRPRPRGTPPAEASRQSR